MGLLKESFDSRINALPTMCKWGQTLSEMDEDDLKIATTIGVETLVKLFHQQGLPLGKDAVYAHRNKTCRCFRMSITSLES